MNENEPIEQSDVPEKKDKPPLRPADFGYRRFNAGEHRKALLRAKSGEDKEGEREAERLESELALMGGGKIMKPQELKGLDDAVKVREQDRKSSKSALETMERKAFAKILKTLEESGKLPIQAKEKTHIFEFKGLTKDGNDMEPQEVQKLLEHVDAGGDIPPNIEFHFHTSFQKDRPETEVIDIDYRLNLHQIMRSGLETTLGSLLSLSYDAAAHYGARKAGTPGETGRDREKEKSPENAAEGAAAFEGMKKQLEQWNIPTSVVRTPQWQALQVDIPEKQKQFSVVFDGTVFTLTEKRLDKNTEIPARTPAEILQYIETEHK